MTKIPFVNFVLLTAVVILTLFGTSPTRVLADTSAIAPSSIVNQSGRTDGHPVSYLETADLINYVTFTTPSTIYRGYRDYFLPMTVDPKTVTRITLRSTYRGPVSSKQVWTWSLYNWKSGLWVKMGTNAGASLNTWKAFTFITTYIPSRFINSSHKIRVQFKSNNASFNALIDYESISVDYTPAVAGFNLNVDASANRKPISPYIYGLNFAKPSFANEIDLPVRRWGGNATSRYNWQNGAYNSALDWYFENSTMTNAFDWNLSETHDEWIAQNILSGTDSIMTIPMIGYVSKDGISCGFNTDKYGAQEDTDYWRSKCGNGNHTNGTPITGNNPLDTSMAVDQNYMQAWVQDMVSKYGDAASGGVKFYNLDNEPELWSETHRDVHPVHESYDELRDKTILYANAIKTADPGAQTFGYASFGWSGYWYSWKDVKAAEADGYSYFPDYATHGNKYQVEWYLDQMHQYQLAHGTRLLDYLDLHYYQEGGVALTTTGDANLQAMRLRSTRALWDPTYRDESWIGGDDQPVDWRYVRLLPRMHDWVNTYYPGTKLAITEYNWGGLESINGALAQADVLGLFGREGLDLATLWNYPNPGGDLLGYDHFESLPGAYAFRMYRNYDGAGSKFGEMSVQASSTDQAQLSTYAAQRLGDSALTIMVINKTSSTIRSNVNIGGFTPLGNAQVYQYSSVNLSSIAHLADQTLAPTGFTYGFPANSVTLFVIP